MPWGAGGAAGPMMTIGQGWAYVGERSWGVSPEERGGKVGGEAAVGGEGRGLQSNRTAPVVLARPAHG